LEAKCIKLYEFGSPKDVLRIESQSIEPPKDNEILVRMLARPINPSDLIPIRGSYSHRIYLPNIPGYEGVDIVEDVGPIVSQHFIGKRFTLAWGRYVARIRKNISRKCSLHT
jgi:NADPH:quinone reductase-like Zn-dependent oxidoreductase